MTARSQITAECPTRVTASRARTWPQQRKPGGKMRGCSCQRMSLTAGRGLVWGYCGKRSLLRCVRPVALNLNRRRVPRRVRLAARRRHEPMIAQRSESRGNAGPRPLNGDDTFPAIGYFGAVASWDVQEVKRDGHGVLPAGQARDDFASQD